MRWLIGGLAVAAFTLILDFTFGIIWRNHPDQQPFIYTDTILIVLVVIMFVIGVRVFVLRAKEKEQAATTAVKELGKAFDTAGGYERSSLHPDNALSTMPMPDQIETHTDEPKDQGKLATSAMAMQLLSDEDLHEDSGWFPGKVPGQESALSILHEHSERERQILEEAQTPLDPPPTPEDVHEAEMNPWPGHTMRETILRNRGQMQSPPSTPPQQPPPQDTNLPPQ